MAWHLCLAASVSVALQARARFSPAAACGAAGAWVAALTLTHGVHALTFINSGAPLHRSILRYGLANMRPLASAFPRETASLFLALAAAFAGGALACWADLRADTVLVTTLGPAPSLAPVAATVIAALALRKLGLFNPARDPLLGLVLGQHIRDYRLPPFDPALAHVFPPGGLRGP